MDVLVTNLCSNYLCKYLCFRHQIVQFRQIYIETNVFVSNFPSSWVGEPDFVSDPAGECYSAFSDSLALQGKGEGVEDMMLTL